MQAVIFCGVQASGKSTFYRERFFRTHIRLNLDMLRTRHREKILLMACLAAKQPCVIDNTNPTIEDRARYIEPAQAAKFEIIGYFFEIDFASAIQRNTARSQAEQVPIKAIGATFKKLQLPTRSEGFDQLFRVIMRENHVEVRPMDEI